MRKLIYVLALVALTMGFGGTSFSADSSEGGDRPSIDQYNLDGAYGTLGFKGLVERTLEKDGWRYTVKELSLNYLPSGKLNQTKEIRVNLGLIATQRPRSGKGYWKQVFEQTRQTGQILNAASPEMTFTNLVFTMPKEAAEQASVIGLSVTDGSMIWPLSAQLKTEPKSLAKASKPDRQDQNRGLSSSGGSEDRRPPLTLKVGSPAPKLQTGKWVQGDPVKEFQNGKAYLVEFWATWCGPCRVSIPHLNELYIRHRDKGLTVIGQDCWEQDESGVLPFVKQLGEKMTYAVALDDKEGSEKGRMAETWMEAAGRNGIPSAFLVDTKGIIAWIGHPMELKDKVIEEVLNGTFDAGKAAEESEQQMKSAPILRSLFDDLTRAVQAQDWTTANAKIAEMEKLLSADERAQLGMIRFKVLIGQKKFTEAYQLADSLSEAQKDNAALQNELAWNIATDKSITERNLELAEKLATRANQATADKDPAILDTLARVCFMQGRKDEAIKMQNRAVTLAEGELKESLQKSLDSYRKGELPKD